MSLRKVLVAGTGRVAAAATAPNTDGVDPGKYGSESIVRIVKTPSGRVGVTPVRRSRRLSATPRRAGDFALPEGVTFAASPGGFVLSHVAQLNADLAEISEQ